MCLSWNSRCWCSSRGGAVGTLRGHGVLTPLAAPVLTKRTSYAVGAVTQVLSLIFELKSQKVYQVSSALGPQKKRKIC